MSQDRYRLTTANPAKLEALKQYLGSTITNDHENIAVVVDEFNRTLQYGEYVSAEFLAEFMTELGLPTVARTLLFSIISKPDIDFFPFDDGQQITLDCLVYEINGETFINPLTGYGPLKATFQTSLRSESKVPNIGGDVKIKVLEFGAPIRSGGLNTPDVEQHVQKFILDAYVEGLAILEQFKSFSDIHDMVSALIQQNTVYVNMFSGWDDDRFGSSKNKVSSSDVINSPKETGEKVCKVLNAIQPNLNTSVEQVEITYPEQKEILGSGFIYKTYVLKYEVEGEVFRRLIWPNSSDALVGYMIMKNS